MKVDFRLYLVTDRTQAPGGDILRAVAGALDGGVRAVQLREKDLPGGELFGLAERMRSLTERYGARLLINDRADVAKAVGADGVHLGVLSLPPAEARRFLGPEALVGCSAHDPEELRRASEEGADFATYGPVFRTPSKERYGPPLGIRALAEACGGTSIPVFALGGVRAGNVEEISRAGCFGVALISGIVASPDPRGAAAEMLESLEKNRVAQK